MFTVLSLKRLIEKPNMEDLANKLLKLCKRNNNIKGIIYYSNYLKKRKEFRKMGELNIDFKSQKIDRDKIKFSKISYGLLFG